MDNLTELLSKLMAIVVPSIVVGLLALMNQQGFERLISQLIVEPLVAKWPKIKDLKKWQPLFVIVTGLTLSVLFNVDLGDTLKVTLPVANDPNAQKAIVGVVVAILSMYMHEQKKSKKYDDYNIDSLYED